MTGMAPLFALLAVFAYFAACDHGRGVRLFDRVYVAPESLR